MYQYSGGHLNPAITLGVLVAGGLNLASTIFYALAQVLGGILGAAFVLVRQLIIKVISYINSVSHNYHCVRGGGADGWLDKWFAKILDDYI